MHSNLTAADVAKYFGCPIIDSFGEIFTHYELKTGNPNYLYASNEVAVFRYKDLSKCHLLLKPLSEISIKDTLEVAKIPRPEITDSNHLMNIGTSIIREVNHGNIIPEFAINKIKDIIDYLRSKGYDMDDYLITNKAKHA